MTCLFLAAFLLSAFDQASYQQCKNLYQAEKFSEAYACFRQLDVENASLDVRSSVAMYLDSSCVRGKHHCSSSASRDLFEFVRANRREKEVTAYYDLAFYAGYSYFTSAQKKQKGKNEETKRHLQKSIEILQEVIDHLEEIQYTDPALVFLIRGKALWDLARIESWELNYPEAIKMFDVVVGSKYSEYRRAAYTLLASIKKSYADILLRECKKTNDCQQCRSAIVLLEEVSRGEIYLALNRPIAEQARRALPDARGYLTACMKKAGQ